MRTGQGELANRLDSKSLASVGVFPEGLLRRAGIVASRREGKWMHYRLVTPKDEANAGILRETLKHLRQKPELRKDIARLQGACCAPQKFELPQTAPQPSLVAIP